MEAPCRVELLGWLRATHGDRVIRRYRTAKTGLLLAYLSFYADRPHARESLIDIHWPECDLAAGRHQLRLALWSLRRQLEPPGVPAGAVILADSASVQLNPTACVTDVREFKAALRAADRARSSAEREFQLEQAVEIYRGELLPGFGEGWVLLERQRLAEAFLQAIHRLIAEMEQARDFPRALRYAHRLVSADPLREEGHRELIRLLAASGEPAAALRQYRELERLLASELDATPDAALRDFARDLECRRHGGMLRHVAPERPSPSHAPALPTGTITFLLAEVEGATVCSGAAAEEAMLLDTQHSLRVLFSSHGGCEVRRNPRTVWTAFPCAADALAAAVAGQRTLAQQNRSDAPPSSTFGAVTARRDTVGPALIADHESGPITPPRSLEGAPTGAEVSLEGMCLRVRMALHTADARLKDGQYEGPALRHATRLLFAAHAGQILLSEKSAVLLRDALSPGLRLADLGLYRLHEELLPERLFQLDDLALEPRQFPPPRAAPAYPGHLPLQITRFFGRAEEIVQLTDLLGSDDVRLVTLTGPGGSGKTRLALEVAHQSWETLRGAVWFVPLVDLADPGSIADRVRDALHLSRSTDVAPVEQVVTALSRQPSLLVLDNLEHLLPEGAQAIHALLERVPALTCLITSRQRLELAGEREHPVSPLPVPCREETPEQLLSCESVQLFVDRAQEARPDFQVTPANAGAVRALCRQLEGIPLALVLASARAQVLTPAQMVIQLEKRFDFLVTRQRDAAPRHRSLWQALDWSYQLLSPELQRFFTRLSVFRGGWTVEAAGAVCEEQRALEFLELLRSCSLVVAEECGPEIRFRLLETLREYAAAQLAPEARIALARQHAIYFLALVESSEREIYGAAVVEWFDRLEREHDNLRAVLDWSVESSEPDVGLRLAGARAVAFFWHVRGHWTEGAERIGRLLALPGAEERGTARAGALDTAGIVALLRGDFQAAYSFLEEAVAIRRELGDRRELAFSLQWLGWLNQTACDYMRAQSVLNEGLLIWRKLEHRGGIAMALNILGKVALDQGDYRTARAQLEEALALRREIGLKQAVAHTLGHLGSLALAEGDEEEAQARYEEMLALAREFRDGPSTAGSLRGLGQVALKRGDPGTARAFFEECLAIERELGNRHSVLQTLSDLGLVAWRQGELERAARLLGATEALRRALDAPLSPDEQRAREEQLASLAADLGDTAFIAAWKAGQALTWDQAVAEALGEPVILPPSTRRRPSSLASLRQS